MHATLAMMQRLHKTKTQGIAHSNYDMKKLNINGLAKDFSHNRIKFNYNNNIVFIF